MVDGTIGHLIRIGETRNEQGDTRKLLAWPHLLDLRAKFVRNAFNASSSALAHRSLCPYCYRYSSRSYARLVSECMPIAGFQCSVRQL